MASLINEEDGSSKLFSNSHISYKLSVIFYESCHMIHMVKGFDRMRTFSDTDQSFILARTRRRSLESTKMFASAHNLFRPRSRSSESVGDRFEHDK